MSVDYLLQYKDSVTNILRGDVSVNHVLEWAEKLQVDISTAKDFLAKKRLVTRKLIIHILREENDETERIRLENILKETESWLSKPKETGYECIFTGCVFRGPRHVDYIHHVTNQHVNSPYFVCNFKHKCRERFGKIKDLNQHLTQHSRSGAAHPPLVAGQRGGAQDLSQPCQCVMCRRQFPTIKKLLQHLNIDHHLETRNCIFKNCEKVMGPQFSSRHHFYYEHTKKKTYGVERRIFD